MKIDGLTIGQWHRAMNPMRSPDGEGAGGGGGGGTPEGGNGDADAGKEGGGDGDDGDAGEDGEGDGEAGEGQDEFVPDPNKTAAENAEAKAAHDKAIADKAKGGEENELIGAPEGDYEDFEVPEGMELNETVKTEFDKLSRDLNLSEAGRKKLVELQGQLYHQAAEKHAETVAEWGETIRKDKALGGKNFEANMGVARNALKEFGSPELKELLENTGYGNHPELIRFAYNVGKTMGEGKHDPGDGQGGGREDAATILYGGK